MEMASLYARFHIGRYLYVLAAIFAAKCPAKFSTSLKRRIPTNTQTFLSCL